MSLTRADGVMADLATPEIDKLSAIPEREREVVQEFLDWLYDERHLMIGKEDAQGRIVPLYDSREKIMAMFFHIDLRRVSQEKDAIVRSLQARHREREHIARWDEFFTQRRQE